MLTGKQVRVRYARDRIIPYFIDPADDLHRLAAEQLLEMYRGYVGRTRGEIEESFAETFGDEANSLVQQGLAKLLEDRCEFEVVSGHPPDELRLAVFREAALMRQEPDVPATGLDRNAVLDRVAMRLSLTPDVVDRGMFADLKTEQRLISFKDLSAEALLDRYNVSLAQACVLRATKLSATIRGEPPARYRQLMRAVKFHRLLCETERLSENTYTLHIDGPLSLFSSTNKYGLQLALFLPFVLLCKDFEVKAALRWGTQKKDKTLILTHKEKLVSAAPDHGMYVPPELGVFAESFRKRVADWEILEEADVYPLGNGFWVPDYKLVHRRTKREVLFEVLGFWRKASAVKHLRALSRYAGRPFVLAVSDALHIEEVQDELPEGIHRFRHMPLADEVARLAERVAGV